MAVAFPTALAGLLDRSSQFGHDNFTSVDIMDDGSPVQREMGDAVYARINCLFPFLTAAEYATMSAFLETNKSETVTWTIDSVDYSGVFDGGWRKTKKGNRYSVTFVYYAKEV